MSLTVFDMIVFGGTGDLALRKLFPGLFSLFLDGRLSESSCILSVSRSDIDADALEKKMRSFINDDLTDTRIQEAWTQFYALVRHISIDIQSIPSMKTLAPMLHEDRCRIFYMALRSDLYTVACKNIYAADLKSSQSRVVLEKPIGNDLASCKAITESVVGLFDENELYRIDHYLGKETVQNLLVLRFANTMFESQWNQQYIDNIQITISETLGVEDRAGYYDKVGALRDMLQNHLLQLLCMTAMEPPSKLNADAVRDEKVKVLRALKPILAQNMSQKVVRGQYREGLVNGKATKNYLDEANVNAQSATETYVAIKAEIDNWRWAGVPFYLRTGKRLAKRVCEIVVNFKAVPHSIFDLQHKSTMANRLVFRLQPDEGITLSVCEKRAGAGMDVRSTKLSLSPERQRECRAQTAYERLLSDVIAGNQTLFVRDDELLAAWTWLDPILQHWNNTEQKPESYNSGTWGPAAATFLLAQDGKLWDDIS